MLENNYKGSPLAEKVGSIVNSSISHMSDSIGSEIHNPVTSSNARSRPELSTDQSVDRSFSTDEASRVHSLSVGRPSMGDERRRPASPTHQSCHRTVRQFTMPLKSALSSFVNMSLPMQFVRMKILLVRAFFVLFKRYKTVLSTTVLHILMACFFCILVGDTGPDVAVVTPVAAFGGLLLIMVGVQYVFFLFSNNLVSDDNE